MSLFKALLKKTFGIKETINDSFFGKMVINTVKVGDKSIYCFTCRKDFPGQNEKVNINVLNDNPEIQDSQRNIAKNLITDYPEVSARINEKLAKANAGKSHKFNVNGIAGFTLQSIDIPQQDNGKTYCEMTYIKNNIYVSVEFSGDKIDYIEIDSF